MPEFSEIPFTPDRLKLSESKSKLENLHPGEALVLSHTATFFNVDGIVISVDVGPLQGTPFLLDKGFIQSPSPKHSLSVSRPEYPVSLFPDESTQQIARSLGEKVNIQLNSHLDSDHFDTKMGYFMAQSNPDQHVYLPPGSLEMIKKHNPPLDENVLSRFHDIPSQEPIKLQGNTGQVTITPFDVAHQGDPRITRSVHGFVFEGAGQRVLYVPDSGLSPELVSFVSRSHSQKPFTQVFVSTAKYQPEGMYKILGPEKAKVFRENFEEHLGHSAIISLAIAELTGLKVNILHQGFLHKSNRKADLSYRLPATDGKPKTEAYPGTPEDYLHQWKELFLDKISRTESRVHTREKLGEQLKPLPGKQGLASGDLRFRFARHIRRWLELFPIPRSHLDNLHMPGPNEIIHAN